MSIPSSVCTAPQATDCDTEFVTCTRSTRSNELLVARFLRQQSEGGVCRVVSEAGPLSANALWSKAQAYRAVMRAHGLERGGVVVIALPTSSNVLAILLAAWCDGCAISLVAHEIADHSGRLSPSRFGQMLAAVSPAIVLTTPEVAEHVPLAQRRHVVLVDELERQASALGHALSEPVQARDSDIAILQFTSGSTNVPKVAPITQAMLAANCAAIAERIALGSADKMVSWLPLHHDMGLSAVTLAWWGGVELVLLPTAMFVRQPLSWLEAISMHRATLSPAPASAYSVLSRFAQSAVQKQLDLSSWRYAWAGAEPVFHKHLEQFAQRMRPLGLRANVLQPSYGMAEAVVAVSLNEPDRAYRTVWLDASALHERFAVLLREPGSAGAIACVSNGRPVSGVEVQIRGLGAAHCGESQAGAICIRGTSVIGDYLGLGRACDDQGWFDTGDIGFVLDGEVFISGRAKDVITRAGLNVSAHDVEWAIEELLSLKEGSVAAFSYVEPELAQERVVAVVAKQPGPAQAEQLRRAISVAVAMRSGLQLDEILFVPRSSIPKTTSGKIQRAALRSAHLRGELASVA